MLWKTKKIYEPAQAFAEFELFRKINVDNSCSGIYNAGHGLLQDTQEVVEPLC